MGLKSKLFGAAGLALSLGIFLVGTWTQMEPEPNIDCTFNPRSGQAPIQLGEFNAPILSIKLSGYLDKSLESPLYLFDGDAVVQIGDVNRKAGARGAVFLSDRLEVNALVLKVEDRGFGRSGLQVNTLNEAGTLDYSSTQAYAFTNKEFKLSHPLMYSCMLNESDFAMPQ